MFAENLKSLRKKKGLSQEELAIRLHVVRQTVSKWEKGLSVLDADVLIRIAEVFEVSVSEMLGVKMENGHEPNAIAEQLSRINEQLAIKNRRARFVWKTAAAVVVASTTLIFIASIFFTLTSDDLERERTPIAVNLDGFNAGGGYSGGIVTGGRGGRSDIGWTFFARSGDGYDTIFQSLSQEELDAFSVQSSIDSGEMKLTLRQSGVIQTIDLSNGGHSLSSHDIDMSIFEPGTIAMRFDYFEAENISFNVRWR